jgi:hypothetical protein
MLLCFILGFRRIYILFFLEVNYSILYVCTLAKSIPMIRSFRYLYFGRFAPYILSHFLLSVKDNLSGKFCSVYREENEVSNICAFKLSEAARRTASAGY